MAKIVWKDKNELMTEEIERKWKEIKAKRNGLLKESDWAVLPDSPLSEEDIELVKQYRQALRDLPQTYSNPDEVVFPNKPECLK